MADLKLPRLSDRAPVKMTISVAPELAAVLADYAAIYEQVYGRSEPVAELVPAILAAFIESDRQFLRMKREREGRV